MTFKKMGYPVICTMMDSKCEINAYFRQQVSVEKEGESKLAYIYLHESGDVTISYALDNERYLYGRSLVREEFEVEALIIDSVSKLYNIPEKNIVEFLRITSLSENYIQANEEENQVISLTPHCAYQFIGWLKDIKILSDTMHNGPDTVVLPGEKEMPMIEAAYKLANDSLLVQELYYISQKRGFKMPEFQDFDKKLDENFFARIRMTKDATLLFRSLPETTLNIIEHVLKGFFKEQIMLDEPYTSDGEPDYDGTFDIIIKDKDYVLNGCELPVLLWINDHEDTHWLIDLFDID